MNLNIRTLKWIIPHEPMRGEERMGQRMKTPDKTDSRREFFRTLGRAALLGSLAAMAFSLIRRPGRADRSRHVCTNRSVCRGCPALAGCILPLGRSFKNALNRGDARG